VTETRDQVFTNALIDRDLLRRLDRRQRTEAWALSIVFFAGYITWAAVLVWNPGAIGHRLAGGLTTGLLAVLGLFAWAALITSLHSVVAARHLDPLVRRAATSSQDVESAA
jgi:uncharacterized membrane protein (DUF485 family)